MSKKEVLIAIYQLNWRDNTFYLNYAFKLFLCYIHVIYSFIFKIILHLISDSRILKLIIIGFQLYVLSLTLHRTVAQQLLRVEVGCLKKHQQYTTNYFVMSKVGCSYDKLGLQIT